MAYIKAVSDQPITRFDHVVVAVMGKFSLEPVGGLARATASNRIRHDDEVFRRIERLPGRKQLVGEARAQPIRAGASVALQEQYGRLGTVPLKVGWLCRHHNESGASS